MTFEPDLISSSLKMFAALALILGGLIAVLYYVKRKARGATNSTGHIVTILGNTYLGLKKSISLVEIPGAILVLGITDDNISLLAKIEDEPLMAEIKEYQDGFVSSPFSQQLRKISSSLRGRHDTTK